jgi:hypothetical protein
VPIAHPTGWATSTEYYIRNSGYKAAYVRTTVVSCPLILITILPARFHPDLDYKGAFYNPLNQPTTYELNMEAFQRSARAIAVRRERTAALMRNARPLPSSNINPDVLNSSVEGTDLSSPIAEPQLLASTPHLAAMTHSRRTVYRTLWEPIILCSSHMLASIVSHSRPMSSVQLLMTSLPSCSCPVTALAGQSIEQFRATFNCPVCSMERREGVERRKLRLDSRRM